MRAAAVSFFWIVLALAPLAQAPAQTSNGIARGRVTGPDDQPLASARVRVWLQGTASEASSTAVSDAAGEWKIMRLPPGRWQIEVVADGYFPAEGWFQMHESRAMTTVDVSLRTLEETSPSYAENRSTVLRWMEKGNALLGQGQPAAARVEYRKAVGALPRDQRPEVLQAIARTHFLEGDVEGAIGALIEALGIAPDDARLVQLLTGVLDSAGRADEAEALLAKARESAAEIAESGAAADAETPRAGGRPQLPPLLPLVEAIEGRTGRFRTALTERSPLSGVATYLERFGMPEKDLQATDPANGEYDLSQESFAVFVPESYDGSEPYGLFVYVSPTPLGGFRNPEFERVLTERKMIWVGAHQSGNGRWGWYRTGLALDAVHNLSRLYSIDAEKVYVGGYSGGGRVASQLTMLYPDVFRGGFFLYGCDYFEQLPVPDRPGASWPARFPAPQKQALQELKSDSSFVFLTGDRDFNRSQTKRIYTAMRDSGFQRLSYLQIPEADHYFGLPPEWFARGLDALAQPSG